MRIQQSLINNFSGYTLEAGCDEAGRGCLAGPVFAAAVIFPKGYENPLINDSKQLTPVKRDLLRDIIITDALHYAVASVLPEEIDKINILNASIRAMHLAVDKMAIKPEYLIIDGNKFNPLRDIPYTCIIKGDAKYLSIAAASILAKCSKDDYMRELAVEFPQYGWERNAGYATQEHRDAIKKYGISPHHRKSFRLTPDEQLRLF